MLIEELIEAVKKLYVDDGGIGWANSARADLEKIEDAELKRIADRFMTNLGFGVESCETEQKREETIRSQLILAEAEPSNLEPFFAAIFGELGAHAATAYQHLCDISLRQRPYGIPVRAPRLPKATAFVRWKWLTRLAQIIYRFPPGLITPEWLAVHGAGCDRETSDVIMMNFMRKPADGGREIDCIGQLLGSVIASESPNSENVYETLALIAAGKHPTGVESSHLYRAFWRSGQSRCHDILLELLNDPDDETRAAAIAQAAVDGGPETMSIALQPVIARGLLSNDQLAWSVGQWFGIDQLEFSVAERTAITETFAEALNERHIGTIVTDAKFGSVDGEQAYFHVVLTGLDDVVNVLPVANQLLNQVAADNRYLAVRALKEIKLPDEVLSDTGALWLRLLEDDNLDVVAIGIWWANGTPPVEPKARKIEAVSNVLLRLRDHEGLLIAEDPQTTVENARNELLNHLAGIVDDIPFAMFLELYHGQGDNPRPFIHRMKRLKIRTEQERELGFSHLERASWNTNLLAAIIQHRLSPEDMSWLSVFLKPSSEARRSTLEAIGKAKPDERAAFVDMLLADNKTKTRQIGLGVLAVAAKGGESLEWVAQNAVEFSTRKKITAGEKHLLNSFRRLLPEGSRPTPKRDDPVALISELPSGSSQECVQSPASLPRRLEIQPDKKAIDKCFNSLRKLYDQYADTVVRRVDDSQVRISPLGKQTLQESVTVGVRHQRKVSESFPLAEIWLEWFHADEQSWLRDSTVLPQICLAAGNLQNGLSEEAAHIIGSSWLGSDEVLHSRIPLAPICRWLAAKHPTTEGANLLLDVFENFLAVVPDDYWRGEGAAAKNFGSAGTSDTSYSRFLRILEEYFAGFGNEVPPDAAARRWQLARAIEQPPFSRRPPDRRVVATAFGVGAANAADLYKYWIADDREYAYDRSLDDSTRLESRLAIARFAGTKRDDYLAVIDRFTDETIDKLLAKKSEKTEAYINVATRIRSVHGIERLMRLLKGLGKKKLARWNHRNCDKQTRDVSVIGQLIAFSAPAPGESYEQFAAAVEQSEKWLTRERLLQLSMFATQWSHWIERALELPGLQDAVEWLAYHSPDSTMHRTAAMYVWHNTGRPSSGTAWDSFPTKIEDKPWRTQIEWRCTPERYGEGPFPDGDHLLDIAQEWYRRAFTGVGAKVWFELEGLIESIASKKSIGFLLELTRALRGESDRDSLRKQIQTEPKPEAVQLLALSPVADGAEREADLSERMRLIHEHRRIAKRQKAIMREKLLTAIEHACKLLAKGAGLIDPERLEWFAMAGVQDQIDAISPLTVDNVTLELVVQPNGEPVILVDKGGKKQKSIPAKIKKDERVKELQTLLKELKTQAKQVSRSLEEAMVVASDFDTTELTRLIQNGLIGPPIRTLVFVQGKKAGRLALTDGKLNLVDHNGDDFPSTDNPLQIAHVTDLLALECLKEWRDVFVDRVQAIDQVHRDLFQPSQAENNSSNQCVTRFADFKMRPGQAHITFGSMRWDSNHKFGEAYLSRRDRKVNIWAQIHLDYVDFATDDLAVKKLWFSDANDTVPLAKVPPRILSETIREINQIVTTAGIEAE